MFFIDDAKIDDISAFGHRYLIFKPRFMILRKKR
jgi:hypothetical protein